MGFTTYDSPGTNFDHLKFVPEACEHPQPRAEYLVYPATCSRYVENYSVPPETMFQFIDPPGKLMKDGPGKWAFSQ